MFKFNSNQLEIVFLCGHRKSGTSMFLNLFDSHRQLLTYPIDLNILYGYFPEYVRDEMRDNDDLINRLNRVIFDDLYQFDMENYGLPIEKFRKKFLCHVKEYDLRNIGEVLTCQLKAFDECFEKKSNRNFVVVKETSIELYAQQLLSVFPNARFIHLIRDPRDNYSALRAGIERYRDFGDDEKKLMFSAHQRLSLGMKIANANKKKMGKNCYLIIRFEDLVENSKTVMMNVAQWIGIDYDSSLLRPTILGKPTKGNNYDNIEMYNISAKNVGRWRERIPSEEAALIEFLLKDEMDKFGYKRNFLDQDCLQLIGEYYKWLNYTYLYYDRFSQ